ncbi:MAG: response regulator [Opitutales bacterium]
MRALLVEDQHLLNNLLSHVLKDELAIEEIYEVFDGEAALEAIQSQSWDLVLLDLNLPKVSGMVVLRQLKQRHPQTPVAVLSSEMQPGTAKSILDTGAEGIFTKDFPLDRLREGLRQILQGSTFYCPESSRLIREFTQGEQNEGTSRLSQRELDVLQLVAEGFSSKEVANRLHISVRTVDAHRRNIMKKCDLRGATEMVRLAVRMHLV